ncbi:MAG: hypothetical protein KDD61_00035 [Bdellovibrionales bacterium]|nr:hypothetical protein [Bdellovibrionales bacterium]
MRFKNSWVLIWAFLGLSLVFNTSVSAKTANICSTPYKPPAKYLALLKEREQQIAQLASQKPIINLADRTLSQLISAKSPLIIKWIQSRNLQTSSESKIALEWRRYYAHNFVLRSYPHSSSEVNVLVDSLMNHLYNKTFPKKEKERFENLFNEAQRQALTEIKKWKIPTEARKKIEARVGSIRLYWMDDFKTSEFKDRPLELFNWGIAYNPANNVIHMGLEAQQYRSDETLYTVFAHELGHSFDPCRWKPFLGGLYPFDSVIACLRSKDSVHALARDDSKMNELIQAGKITNEMAETLKLLKSCNNSFYPPLGIQADQILESFADWFAAEVVADSKYLNLEFRKDLCQSKTLQPGTSYPSNQDRLHKIYLANPKIQKKLALKSDAKYCALSPL